MTRSKRIFLYCKLMVHLGIVIPVANGMGLTPLVTPEISLAVSSTLSREAIIASLFEKSSLTKLEVEKLYDLSMKYKANIISHEKVMIKLRNLRGGDALNDISLFIVTMIYIMIRLSTEANAVFVPHLNAVPQNHPALFYGKNYKLGQQGSVKGVGPKSITVRGMTRNAWSEKKDPSPSSFIYEDIMEKLDSQSYKRIVTVQVGD